MASDRQVSAQIVLRALMEVQRQGRDRVLTDLEKTEPDLAEWVMESLGQINKRLLAVGATHKQTLALQRDMELLVLVALSAQRRAHYELWKDAAQGTPLGKLDPTLEEGATPPDVPPGSPRDSSLDSPPQPPFTTGEATTPSPG